MDIENYEKMEVMDMSDNFVGKNDREWEKFLSTGSIYDYLKYKNCTVMGIGNGVMLDSKGGTCETGNKRNSG